MASLKVKKGDKVVVITGKDKGRQGKVTAVLGTENRVVVEGANMVTKHRKPRSATRPGGIIKQEAPLNASNVMVVCPKCSKATRVGYSLENDKKVRICKKCGATL